MLQIEPNQPEYMPEKWVLSLENTGAPLIINGAGKQYKAMYMIRTSVVGEKNYINTFWVLVCCYINS